MISNSKTQNKIANYLVSYSKRRTISISVDKDLNIKIKAPTHINEAMLHKFVTSKSDWIQKKIQFFNEINLEKIRLKELSKNKCYFLGNLYEIKTISDKNNNLGITDNVINVFSKESNNELYTKHLIAKWHWEQAKLMFNKIAKDYFAEFAKYKLKPPIIVTANLKGKWGQCDSNGVIKLNKELIKTPLECIEYVVVHELCHLLVKNHGKNFYKLMDVHYPDWKHARIKLRKFATFKLD